MMTIRGRYILDREIGRGASGSVWTARDTQLERRVAVKVLRADCCGDPAAHKQFEREARTIAQLRCPYVVQVHDAGVHEESPFIVMDLLEGESLEQRLDRNPRLPLAMAARIVADVAKGLTTTHRAGIVHRDVKPANVFIAREHGRDLAKLLDFGIATLEAGGVNTRPSEPLESGLKGTPSYMSPEQIAGGEVDHQTDVWALGVLAYRMLTGRVPFEGNSLIELQTQMNDGAFAAPSTLLPELRGTKADAFFARALAVPPGDRFHLAGDLAREFTALADSAGATVTKVLFIDDEEDMELLVRQRFRRELREKRYEFYFARDGARGLDVLSRHTDIDVVFTDLNMPEMDGLTFLARVPETNPLVRVVVVSAYSDMSNIRSAMNRGAFDFVCKPIDFNDLEHTMAKCADDARQLRKALRSHEENGILRALVGTRAADRVVAAMRAAVVPACESFEGSIVFAGVRGVVDVIASGIADEVFEQLNAYFELFAPDFLSQRGSISQFVGTTMVTLFQGEEHLGRAVDAALAIRNRMRAIEAERPEGLPCGGVAIGVATGLFVAGDIGSLVVGRIEHAVLGEPVSTAAFLQRIAATNDVLVSGKTVDALRGQFVCEALEAGSLGSEGAIGVYRVIGRAGSFIASDAGWIKGDTKGPPIQPKSPEEQPASGGDPV